MTFNDILELLKQKQQFSSFDQVASYLGYSRRGFFEMKRGRGGLKDKTIERLMEGTGLEAPIIVAAWEAEHGRTEKVRASWKRWLQNVAAVVILSIVTLLQPVVFSTGFSNFQNFPLYTLCAILPKKKATITVASTYHFE